MTQHEYTYQVGDKEYTVSLALRVTGDGKGNSQYWMGDREITEGEWYAELARVKSD